MVARVHGDLFSRQPVTMPLATCASFFQAQITPGSPHNLALSLSARTILEIMALRCSFPNRQTFPPILSPLCVHTSVSWCVLVSVTDQLAWCSWVLRSCAVNSTSL